MLVKLFDAPENIDQKIVRLARVSSENPDNPNYKGLLKYLLKEGHYSPFDMMNVVIEIDCPRDIGRQILRHTGLKPQELSQRYADVGDMLIKPRECRLQDLKNRQNSFVCEDVELNEWWEQAQKEVLDTASYFYTTALKKGVAKECARVLMPEGLTNSKMYFNGSIRSWLFYCKARLHESTQKEHRQVAEQVIAVLSSVAPDTTAAFLDVHCPSIMEVALDTNNKQM